MEHRRLHVKSLIVTALVVALAALYLAPMLATAATGSKAQATRESKALPQVAITLTNKGIVVAPKSLKGDKNYLLTVKNNTSKPRGIEMIGIDKAASPTVRYTKILKTGKSEQFRWYFAKGKTVYVRDVFKWTSDKGNAVTVTFGRMRKAIDVN